MPTRDAGSDRRTQSHARALLGRIDLGGAGILLVRGEPDPDRLLTLISSWGDPPTVDPSPVDLGFAAADLVPLTRGGLGTRSRSVQRWRSELETRLAGRIGPAERRALDEERAELDQIAARLAGLHGLLDEPPDRSRRFWLAPDEEAAHAAMLRDRLSGRFVPAEVAWLARLIHWTRGRGALERFLTTVREGLGSPAEQASRQTITQFLDLVTGAIASLPPAEHGKPPDPGVFRRTLQDPEFAARVARLRRATERLPASLRGPDRLGLPGRDSEINLRLLRNRCHQLLEAVPAPPPWDGLAAIAALYLTDGAEVALSWAAAQRHLDSPWEAESLRRGASDPGYRLLLERLERIPETDLEELRRFHASGATLEDLIWWASRSGERLGKDQRPEALGPFRIIVEWLRVHGSKLTEEELTGFWEAVATGPGAAVAVSLAGFLGWLGHPAASLVGEVDGLIRILCLPAFRTATVDRLRAWSDPPARGRLPVDCPEGLPPELGRLMRRLSYFQRLAGEPARVPGSIRRPLESAARTEHELAFLRGLGERRDAEQAARLAHLERRPISPPGPASVRVDRLVRQAHEVIAITAVAAARTLVRAEVADWWRSRFGSEPALEQYRWQELTELMRWAEALGEDGRQSVGAILAAYHAHGGASRSQLPANAGWLTRAAGAIDLDEWLRPPRQTATVGKGKKARTYTIAVATDPRDVFLMGSRFQTCLGLHDGQNRDAVIANAADANKAVLYAFAEDGAPAARRLVGVTPDWGMVGYRLYAHERSEELKQAIEAYCGAWAARAGLRLADTGAPAVLARRFWYDDGAEPWSAAALAAYRRLRPEGAAPAVPVLPALLSRLHAAIRAQDRAALESLDDLDLGSDWSTAVAFWRLRVGGVAPPAGGVKPFEATVLSDHLAATGQLRGAADPLQWDLPDEPEPELWHQLFWSLFGLLPPDRRALSNGSDLLLRVPPGDGAWRSRCFSTCRITPALAALGFRKVIALLGRYVQWAPESSCGCPQDLRPHWARVLQLAWLREPDVSVALEAIADPEPLTREILRAFCLRQPERRFQQPLRRLLRTLPAGEETVAVRQTLRSMQARFATRDEADELEAIVLGSHGSTADRLDGLAQLARHPGRLDAALAAVLCAVWAGGEREQVGLAIREAFVRACAARLDECDWQVWPLLHWLATLDPDRQARLLASLWATGESDPPASRFVLAQILESEHALGRTVILQALNHPDAPIRQAAIRLLQTYAHQRPEELTLMLSRCAPWIHPDSYDDLRRGAPGEPPDGPDATSLPGVSPDFRERGTPS